MELSAKYAYKVYENKSFSGAAKELFISQPALSSAISRLENELGFKIFDRATVPITLTQEGKIYIDSLEEIIEIETVMHQRISRLSDMSYGSLSVGGSSQAAYHLLSVVCAEFSKRYPQIEVELDMGNVGTEKNLSEKIEKHTLDLLVGYDYSSLIYEKTPLFEEQFIIAMRQDYEFASQLMKYAVTRDELLSRSYSPEKEIEDLSIFKDVKFLTFGKDYNTTKKMAKLIGNYAVSNYTIKNVRHGGMHYNMMRSGLGALMTTDTIIRLNPLGAENLVFFVPKSRESMRTLYIARESALKPTAAMKNFISLAQEICNTNRLFEEF